MAFVWLEDSGTGVAGATLSQRWVERRRERAKGKVRGGRGVGVREKVGEGGWEGERRLTLGEAAESHIAMGREELKSLHNLSERQKQVLVPACLPHKAAFGVYFACASAAASAA